jgi:hypothetical protein
MAVPQGQRQREQDHREPEALFKAAKGGGYHVFMSPHYYYSTDNDWLFRDPLAQVMHDGHMFERKSMMDTTGQVGSSSDRLERFNFQ